MNYVGIDELTLEDFRACGNPSNAFRKLTSKMNKHFSRVEFFEIHTACLQLFRSPGDGQFSGEVTKAIYNSNDFKGLLYALINSNYWNWLDTRIMEAMAMSLDNLAAEHTIKNYVEYISAFKLEDVLPDIPVNIEPSSKYITIKEKFDCSDVKGLTVGHILKHRPTFFYKILNFNPHIPKLCSITTGCLQLIWSIPRNCGSDVYNSALANVHKFENFDILYLKIEYYPTIYSPKYSHIDDTLPGM